MNWVRHGSSTTFETGLSEGHMLVYGTLFFFYNNIFYKNIEAEIYNILRIFQE